MTSAGVRLDAVVAALALPLAARLDQRVPKKALLEAAPFVSADKKLLNDAIAELTWVAALKPESCGLAAVDDALRPVLELQVLRVRTKSERQPPRLLSLLHRVVPYPVLLLVDTQARALVSVSRKRRAEAGDGLVLDGPLVAVELDGAAWTSAFLPSLGLPGSRALTLPGLYGHWCRCLVGALRAACTGSYGVPASDEAAAQVQADLHELTDVQRELKKLQQAIKKETQLARKIDLNEAIRAATTDLDRVQRRLQEQASP